MASRQTKRNNKRSRKHRSNKRKTMRKMRAGGCGCQGAVSGGLSGAIDRNSLFFNGGGELGPASFKDVPIHSFYPLNDYKVDPQHAQQATRLDPNIMSTNVGGSSKRKQQRQSKRQMRKLKGGSAIPFSYAWVRGLSDPLLVNNTDAISSSNTTAGSILGNNILSGIATSSYNPSAMRYSGPVLA